MDSPLSSIIADIVMQDLEKMLNSLDFDISFYRYVDDIIIIAIPSFKVQEVLEKFNHIITEFSLFVK